MCSSSLLWRIQTNTPEGTPLTLIQGPLQDSLALASDSKVKEHLKMASRNVVRLARLVDSIMDFSKLAANRLEGQ